MTSETLLADRRAGMLRLATVISNLFSPPVLSAPVVALAVWLSPEPGAWRYGALFLAVAVFFPLLDVLWLVRTGRIADIHIPDRKKRTQPFLVSILCTVLALLLLAALSAPPAMLGLARAMLLQTVVLFTITLGWQISIHTATIAGMVTLAVLAIGASAALLAFLVPLVGWSRVYLRRHTLAQVIAGVPVGSVTLLWGTKGFLW